MAGGGAGGAEAVEESIPVCMGGGGRDEDGTEPREIINYNKKMDRHRTEECVVYIYIFGRSYARKGAGKLEQKRGIFKHLAH